jgi:ATP-dependent helicase/DNAse subunit B
MPATLITGGASTGKTRAALEEAKVLFKRESLARVWALLPTDLQVGVFRERLFDVMDIRQTPGASFSVETFDFYAFYQRILQSLGTPQRRLQETARYHLIRHLLLQRRADLTYFHKIADKPGLVRVVAEFIQELKQALITPERFTSVAQTAKDRDLALLYTDYQLFLQEKNLVDREGEGWLALAELQKSSDKLQKPSDKSLKLEVDLLIVDGFDQFNTVQIALLGELSKRLKKMVVTLTYDPDRAETAHRRFAQTYQHLTAALTKVIEKRIDSPDEPRHLELNHLSDHLFESNAPQFTDSQHIRYVEAPDPRREVETVYRYLKSLLRGGETGAQCVITARDFQAYVPYLLELSQVFGIPLQVRGGSPLLENPAIATLCSLIDVASGGFQRRAVLDVLNNRYLQNPYLSPLQIGQLDQISRQRLVIGQRETWEKAIMWASQPTLDEDGEEHSSPIPDSANLLEQWSLFCDRVTPPPYATAADYINWIEGLIGGDPLPDDEDADDSDNRSNSFRLIETLRADHPNLERFRARDLIAYQTLTYLLADLLAGYDLIDPKRMMQIEWAAFRAELQIALENVRLNPTRPAGSLSRGGRVLATSVYDLRGVAHRHVFLLGNSEGQFPAPAREDELYHDSERKLINQRLGENALITRANEADESSLFYEMTALPRQSLMFTRPYLESGSPKPASPYWEASRRLFTAPKLERIPLVTEQNPATAAHPAELLTMSALALNETNLSEEAIGAIRWLSEHSVYGERWKNSAKGQRVELLRKAGQPSVHTGYMYHTWARGHIADKLGPNYVWSATQFNQLGTCAYQFFSARLLRLEPLKSPEMGFDSRQRGSIFHAILEATYRQIGDRPLTPETLPIALQSAIQACDQVFSTAPETFKFLPSPLWEQEKETLFDDVIHFVTQDLSDQSALGKLLEGTRRTIGQEVKFGGSADNIILATRIGNLLVRGSMDRVDQVGDQIALIDYKTGSASKKNEEMTAGREVQLFLYMQVASRLFKDQRVVGGMFWGLNGKSLGSVNAETDQPALDQTLQTLTEKVTAARKGEFPDEPSQPEQDGKCSKFCEFSQLCRYSRYTR